jgi:hypothetical protein
MVQVVEHLPGKCKAQSSNPRTEKKRRKMTLMGNQDVHQRMKSTRNCNSVGKHTVSYKFSLLAIFFQVQKKLCVTKTAQILRT